MDRDTRSKKIRDFYHPVTNPSGGAKSIASLFGGLAYKGEPAKPAADPYYGGQSQMPADYNPSADQNPTPKAPVASPAGYGPVRPPVASPTAGSRYRGQSIDPNKDIDLQVRMIDQRMGQGSGKPQGGPAGAGAARGGAPVPPQWLKPDGTFKTPEEVAADVGATLRGAAQGGDAALALRNEIGADGRSTEQLRADARRLGNVRNDIASGEADPYKVGAKSGIAYTPAELSAIEKAYAGIYDPALDSALAKVETRQAEEQAAAESARRMEEARYKAELDASAPFTLGKDQVRYDGQGNPIAVGVGDTPSGAGATYVAGQDPTVDAFIYGIRQGTYKASDVPEEYRAQVAQGMAATRPAVSQSSIDTISVIDQLSGAGNLENISGFRISDPSSLFPGTQVQGTMNLAKQLKGMLSLENRDQLKGSGAISDFEFRVLGDASSALGIDENGRTNLSPEAFQAELDKLKLKLQVGETTLTDDELIFLRDKGYTVEEIREYGSPQPSFSSAGNASASTGTGNRPQRNHNPGNVKAGGLADSLAIGVDDQDHLIFPDDETGFRAMTLDLTAKVNGQSRHNLPPNPTIRQIGKVYAEDPNWPIGVAKILGVSPDTPAGSISMPALARAVATQEGYYNRA
jgi:hypothetical protein